ncbi:hypothetical protein [uncultured Roseobacter sp.]|uniref:hypothetical protein n=1 Tax=uncultured Roseobacter sp. TaxID=114847 RepID=UPI0026311BEF|nr:hypothetical protein [uncultured Roseobacter sp.]
MFSPISEAIVLFSIPAVFWHMLWVLTAGGATVRKRIIVSAVILLWTAYAYANIRYGFATELIGGNPAIPLAYLATAAVMALVFRDYILGDGVPQRLLIALQLFRPIGLVFVLENARGTLPWTFAQPAGWGDLIAGLTALAVLVRYWRQDIPPHAVVLVAVVGLLDFASAFFFGFTSSASPVQLFAFDNPNRVIEYPLGLIPVFLVPYAVVAHILSLSQLTRDQNGQAEPPLARRI